MGISSSIFSDTQITPLFVKVFNQNPDGGGNYQDADHVNEKSFHDLFLEIYGLSQ